MSQTGDGVYDVRSVGGLEFSKSAIEVMQINTCLFLSKGIAEYLFVAASHEFFIPQGNNWNFQDVFSSIAAKSYIGPKDDKTLSIWQKSKADDSQARAQEHAHPNCYISVASDLVYNPVALESSDSGDPWIGLRYRGIYLHPNPCLLHVNSSNDLILSLSHTRTHTHTQGQLTHRVSTIHTTSCIITHSYLSLPSSLMDDIIIFTFEDFLTAPKTAPTAVPVLLCPLRRSSKALRIRVVLADCMRVGQHVLTAVATVVATATAAGT